ncbi:hypothetical protein V8D89_002775 [Ganoderma adspersum]
MNASTTPHYASHQFTSSYSATLYSSYDVNEASPPIARDGLDDLAQFWNYAMTDEPSMYDRPSSVRQLELDSAQQRMEFPSVVDPMPLLSAHPSDVSLPPGPYDVGSHHDLHHSDTRLHFQYGSMRYYTPSIQYHPTVASRSLVAPREPEAFPVPCVAPTLITSLVPDAPRDPHTHYSPLPKSSEAHNDRHVSPHRSGDVCSPGPSASPVHSSYSLSPIHSSYSPSPSPEPSQSRPHLKVSKRRNVRVRLPAPSPTRGPSSPTATTTANRWKCPYCPHVQRNRRSPDLKRHVATHTRADDDASWVCCGFPTIDALECGVPGASMLEENMYEHNGMFMIGGCRKTFSRKDAYVRHLRREKGKCFGDADASYQVGNAVEM